MSAARALSASTTATSSAAALAASFSAWNRPMWPTPITAVRSGLIGASASRLVEARLARRARLESLVHPVVLLGHLGDALLDVGVHAARVGGEVIGGEIVPRRLDAHQVARAAGQHARHAGQNLRAGDARDARQA